jgi:hypothetical protein
LNAPEFYSESYRNKIYEKFGLQSPKNGEGVVNGNSWQNSGDMSSGYNESFGRIRFRVGSPKTQSEYIAWRRAIFLHGGRQNYLAATKGCIRADDAELETLAANFIAFMRQGDAITTLTVRD